MLYGILKSATNTGLDSELQCVFTAPLQVMSNQPSYSQDMLNLSRKASSQNVQRWEVEAGISPSNNSADFMTHSVEFGHNSKFYIRVPQVAGLLPTNSSGNVIVLPNTQVAVAQGVGYDALATTENMIAGEFFQITGDEKVYIALGSGKSIKIAPRLHQAAAFNAAVIRGTSVKMLVRYDTSVRLGITYTDGILSNPGSVKFIEAI